MQSTKFKKAESITTCIGRRCQGVIEEEKAKGKLFHVVSKKIGFFACSLVFFCR